MTARIAILPDDTFGVREAVAAAGAQIVPIEEADGLIWSNPADPRALRHTVAGSDVRWVQVTSAGVEKFRLEGCLDGRRVWTSARGLYGEACSEHVLALTLSATRRLHVHARKRDNQVAQGFSAAERLLSSQHVLVLGTGGIGVASARLLKAFNARVTGVNRSGRAVEPFDEIVAADQLARVVGDAGVVVLCAPLTAQTNGLFDEAMFGRMREGSWLINVARGEIVDTSALVRALRSGHLGGACLDVTTPALLPADHPLWDIDTALVTPHVAATWAMSRDLFVERVARNVRAFDRGEELEGVVDQTHGY